MIDQNLGKDIVAELLLLGKDQNLPSSVYHTLKTSIMTVTDFEFKNEIPLVVEKPADVVASTEKTVDVAIRTVFVSNFSDISYAASVLDTANFHPGTIFHIAQRGIGAVRFPIPSSELVTRIFHSDGSLAYTSARAKKSSGSAVLSHGKLGDLISTTYRWGPRRPPVLTLLQGESGSNNVTVNGKWISRTTSFAVHDGRVFEWSYAHMKDGRGKRVNIIVLREKETRKILAQLVRGEGSRTEGTSRCTAGNGGQLIFDHDAASHIDEALILATCLTMLKKEIDHRRGVQTAVICGTVAAAC